MGEHEMIDEELYHHGIKGMKWGVRRTPEELGHDTGKAKGFVSRKISQFSASAKAKRAEKAAAKRERKGPSAMTGEELTNAISRMQQEKQYRLLKEEADKANESSFKRFLKNTGSKLLDRTVNSVLDSMFSDKVDAKAIDLSRTSLDDLDDNEVAALAKREENLAKIRRNHQGDIQSTNEVYRAQVKLGRGEVQSWLSNHQGETVSSRGGKQSKRKAQRRTSEAQNALRTRNTQSEQVQNYNNQAAEAEIAAARERARQRIAERRNRS